MSFAHCRERVLCLDGRIACVAPPTRDIQVLLPCVSVANIGLHLMYSWCVLHLSAKSVVGFSVGMCVRCLLGFCGAGIVATAWRHTCVYVFRLYTTVFFKAVVLAGCL